MNTAATPGRSATPTADDRSLDELISEVTTDLTILMRQEAELPKAEVQQSARRAGTAAGLLGSSAVAGHLALLFLSIALWWALGTAIGFGWSGLIVGILWTIAAAILAAADHSSLKSVRGLPRTTETVTKISDAAIGPASDAADRGDRTWSQRR